MARFLSIALASLAVFSAVIANAHDGLAGGNRQLDATLTAHGIGHSLSPCEGDHTNRVAERFERWVKPFFSENLIHE